LVPRYKRILVNLLAEYSSAKLQPLNVMFHHPCGASSGECSLQRMLFTTLTLAGSDDEIWNRC